MKRRGRYVFIILALSAAAFVLSVGNFYRAAQRNVLATDVAKCANVSADRRQPVPPSVVSWTERISVESSYTHEAALISRCWLALNDDEQVIQIGQLYPPLDAMSAFTLGQAWQATGEQGHALQTWQAFPTTGWYYRWACTDRLNASDCPAAVEACQLATSINPNLGEAYAELGRVYTYCTQRFDDALAAYRRADELEAGSPTMWLAMAHTFDLLGRSIEAAQVVEQHQLTGALADTMRANSLRQQGRLAEAVLMYQAAITQKQNDPWAYHGLALTYQSLGQLSEARSAWQQALQIEPGFGPAINGLRTLTEK